MMHYSGERRRRGSEGGNDNKKKTLSKLAHTVMKQYDWFIEQRLSFAWYNWLEFMTATEIINDINVLLY